MNYENVDLTDSENWIEKRVECMYDRADKKFMNEEITEQEYKELTNNIKEWADKAYQFANQFKTK